MASGPLLFVLFVTVQLHPISEQLQATGYADIVLIHE